MRSRQEIVQDLAQLRQDLSDLVEELNQYPWDCTETLYQLTQDDLARIIGRRLTNDITAEVLEDWANAIECREDLSYSDPYLEQVVIALANPVAFDLLNAKDLQVIYAVLTGKGMQPRIKSIEAKTLVGMRLSMSLTQNRTGDLWRAFMPLRHQITNRLSTELISLQTYPAGYFDAFNPATEFEKWALAEVVDADNVPDKMQAFTLPGGLYAVFLHKGSSSDTRTIQYIFTNWLPASAYELDHRPHFEVLGANYKNADPDSEEEIWIPIRPKAN